MKLTKQLVHLRAKYDLTQAEVAKIAGISQSVYATIEKGVTSDQSEAAKLVRKKIIDDREEIKRRSMKKRRMMDNHRIPNIPNFYQRLEKLCDEEGQICADKNPEMLELLQIELGVRPSPSVFELLRQFRGTLSRRVFAKWLGVKEPSYTSVEKGDVGSSSRVLQSIISSDCFTEEEQHRLQVAYVQLKEAEK